MKVLRTTGTVLIVLGSIILFFVVYELYGTSLETKRHQSTLREQFTEILDDPVIPASPEPSSSVSPEPSPVARSARPRAIAQILIPKLGVDEIVVEGVSLKNLAWGPGRYPETAAIGAEGTTGIAGHRTGWGSPFINLDKLRTGDEIVLVTTKGTYTYRVTRGNLVVEPNDTWVIAGDPESKEKSKLVLTTCTPKYTSRDRLIVWADLAGFQPRAA